MSVTPKKPSRTATASKKAEIAEPVRAAPRTASPGAKAKPRRRQAERRETTRARILDASLVLLRKHGCSGLRTLDVAAAAGVSQGAQFHHFPTKRDLIVATIDYANQKLLLASRKRAESRVARGDPITRVIEDASEFFFSDYFFAELAIGINGEVDPELLTTVRDMTRDFRISVEEAWLKSLEDAGYDRVVANDILALTLSLVRGFAVRTLIEPDRTKINRLLKTWRSIVEVYMTEKGSGLL